MRHALPDRDISRIGASGGRVFGINSGSAKAFKILSSSLYKDKILAIVREYSCNAFDSHLFAGQQDIPFHVHLPNALEPWFSVKDFGLGLSRDQVFSIWSTYFESTKNDLSAYANAEALDASLVGSLGLGSKCGFSYVDSFTLISRFNGERRSYTAFVNESGCPEVVEMGEAASTDESNGVEVVIPVSRAADYGAFSLAAQSALELFDPAPIVTGNAAFEIQTRKPVLQGDGWELYPAQYGRTARAIMGRVAYPIDRNLVEEFCKGSGRLPAYAHLIRNNIDITFPLGALDFTAGREELSYDKEMTLPALRDRLGTVLESIKTMVETAFAKCDSERAARLRWGELSSAIELSTLFPGGIDWRGKRINSSNIDIYEAFKESNVNLYIRRSRGQKTTFDVIRMEYSTSIPASCDLMIGNVRSPDQRARMAAYDKTKQLFVLGGEPAAIAKVIAGLDGFEAKQATDLPKQERIVQRKAPKVRNIAVGYWGNKGNLTPASLPEATFDLSKPGYFVRIDGARVQTSKEPKELTAEMFHAALRYLSNGLLKGHTNIAVSPKKMVSEFLAAGWSDLGDVMADEIASLSRGADILAGLPYANLSQHGGIGRYLPVLADITNPLGDDHPLCRRVRKIKEGMSKAKSIQEQTDLCRKFGHHFAEKPIDTAYVTEGYPVLGVVLDRLGYADFYGESKDALVEKMTAYIQQADRLNAL